MNSFKMNRKRHHFSIFNYSIVRIVFSFDSASIDLALTSLPHLNYLLFFFYIRMVM